MKIIAIKTNKGYLISNNIENKNYNSSSLGSLLFDSFLPEKTFKLDWFKIKNKPTKIEKEISQPTINRRWEIKSEFNNGTFKSVWLYQDVYDEDFNMVEEFRNIKGLYEYKEDEQPNVLQNIDFEWEEILEIDIFKEPTGFSYKTAGQWSHKEYDDITEKSLKYDILTQVLTPSILLHTQPCKLSSKNTYDIIRKFVKENINPRVAEITSDYDFCFTVKKKIPLAKSYTYETDVNNNIFSGKKKKPKYETRLVDKKSVTIFEMTHDQAGGNGKGYGKYTLVTPFEAENQDNLKEYIDAYLDNLINAINEQVCECDKCNGTGVLFNVIKKH
jgi:hypothetical protein